MDRYLTVRKPILAPRAEKDKVESSSESRTSPYPPRSKLDDHKQRLARLSAPLYADGKKPSSSEITKHLLKTLADESNPITHSNIYERSDTVVSAATGHQRGEGRTPGGDSSKTYFEDRNRKLALQREKEPTKGVLSNVRVYINGYLSGTTDIEMKRTIALAGGTTILMPSGATHILTSQQPSGSKTHKFLTTKSRHSVHVVRPEWVTDSIKAGKRLQESQYAVIRPSSTRNLVDMIKAGGPS
ncbi:hypothetical protein HYDPIDRAFT_35527 [Hydnomerulius pinastri MD-312]|nr:hypothetical protein HYDPIDRAFT_35527 [Hydnomerulius pinastri MD-312]